MAWYRGPRLAYVRVWNDGQRPKVGVALGGGFARGIAHIGVLRVLEENEIPMDFIAGTSVGALIAATYASGTTLDEMENRGAPRASAILAAGRFRAWAWPSNERSKNSCTASRPRIFSQMKIPLSIVATDLLTGESVHFTEVKSARASRIVRLSGTIPSGRTSGRFLVDGFLTNRFPRRLFVNSARNW